MYRDEDVCRESYIPRLGYRIENQKSSYIHTGMFKILYNFIDLWKKKVPKILQFYLKL